MKIYSVLSILIVACLALIPPIDFIISNPQHPYWLWMILIAGFFGLFTLFMKTEWPVKAIAVAAFVSCFFSAAPYISFTSYVSVVLCCYLYIVCSRIEDWSLIYKCLMSLVMLQVLVMAMQFFHKDSLLNFGLLTVDHYGSIGHRMQMGSMAVVLSSILICFDRRFILLALLTALFCNSSWTFLVACVGICIYFYQRNKQVATFCILLSMLFFIGWSVHNDKFVEGLDGKSGRVAVWEKSVLLTNARPWTGWGIGTYKDVFHPLSGMKCVPWRTAHNFIFQLLFEVGYPLTICLLFGLGWLLWRLYTHNMVLLLCGLSMLILDGLVHFPDRMIQTVPMIVLFLGYVQFNLKRYT